MRAPRLHSGGATGIPPREPATNLAPQSGGPDAIRIESEPRHRGHGGHARYGQLSDMASALTQGEKQRRVKTLAAHRACTGVRSSCAITSSVGLERSRGSVSFEFLGSQQVPTRRPILIFRNVPYLEACAALEQIDAGKA